MRLGSSGLVRASVLGGGHCWFKVESSGFGGLEVGISGLSLRCGLSTGGSGVYACGFGFDVVC